MIDETMLPREGLFDRTFSVLVEIRHPNNSTKLVDINPIRPASLKRRQKERKLYPHGLGLCCKLHLRYKREAGNDLVVRHFEYSESNLDCMGIDELLVCTC